ncbi:TPA: class C sortase [Streptococcus suis]|uniref:class C sortase n=1 Tax=Streptococcus suis TaxID=1307 RepID=UPI00040FA6C2|nr:class C sortase [Streptococcus suis]HEM3203989.1 class C sortase [Streptococcus suis 8830]HEM5180713.1 class C sortase [Streptococcus suis]HEM5185675.1 class C sortase [Streptococcus suis]HEM5274578.1 class C sortase [Streptococcus suis]HEM5280543.1 class C sortase [Streptococcus suis]
MNRRRRHKETSSTWLRWLYRGLITLGVLAIFYPFASQTYYQYLNKQEVSQFDSQRGNLDNSEIQKRIELAHAYNRTLTPAKLGDPFTKKEKEGVAEYARMLQVSEKIGYISIPSINQEIPIRAGTGENVLQEGAGHLEGTSLPVGGHSTHTVITAHRGLPSASLFTDLDDVKIGDIFYITNIKEKMAYKVDQILTVEPDNFDPVLVSEGHDYATLLTCTPYMINSHRLLVRGERIPLPKGKNQVSKKIDYFKKYYWFIFLTLAIVLILLCYLAYKFFKGMKR